MLTMMLVVVTYLNAGGKIGDTLKAVSMASPCIISLI